MIRMPNKISKIWLSEAFREVFLCISGIRSANAIYRKLAAENARA